ncbi:MAG: hypothetical protein H6702_05560 [Myxococcales bacterium]|nr:hypothetical protein [Myxococcales bacterium]
MAERLKTRALNRLIDVGTAEPVVRLQHAISKARAQARARFHDLAVLRLEQLGVATRIDLAGVEDELAHLTDAAARLEAAVRALEAAVKPLRPTDDPEIPSND